jgi:hypothetical protein
MLLCEAQIQNTRKVAMACNTGQVLDLGSLYQWLARLHDKRKAKGKRYALATILLGMFLAKLSGEDKPSGMAEWVAWRGEWIAQVLGLKRKSMPSHHTYRRTLADILDAEEFEAVVRDYHRYCGEAGYLVVASMDGKMCRGTIDLEVSEGLCLLALFLPGEGVTLAEIAIESKQNEISAAPTLLGWVDLCNKVVMGDALHTQQQISIQIGTATLSVANAWDSIKQPECRRLADQSSSCAAYLAVGPALSCLTRPKISVPTNEYSICDFACRCSQCSPRRNRYPTFGEVGTTWRAGSPSAGKSRDQHPHWPGSLIVRTDTWSRSTQFAPDRRPGRSIIYPED